jgi:molybdate transport repressor ModE-like protein
MKPCFNLWVETEGGGSQRLARAVARAIQVSGSIRAAMSSWTSLIRRAWEGPEMESRSGLRLLETEVGGEGGGRTRLTDEARLR